jgi:hypothetical protein
VVVDQIIIFLIMLFISFIAVKNEKMSEIRIDVIISISGKD